MTRRYLTRAEFSKKYNVPRTTLNYWIKMGYIEVRKDVRPMLIPDDQGIPYHDPDIYKGRRYQWKEKR